jgi:catechol 2,3-dioxygenase-like lactoylglutathione lyase family enzyme
MLKEGNVTVAVVDLNRAIRFYTEALGLRLRYRTGDEWAEILAPGIVIGLHPTGERPCKEAPPVTRPGALRIGFTVERLDLAQRALEARGVRFRPEIEEDEAVRIAWFNDPDGTPLYLCELRRPLL